jgi:hypothetical protein
MTMLPSDRDNAPAPATAENSGFVVMRPPPVDHSEAEQSAAEADREVSTADQAASNADRADAISDQLASDRDQAAADRQHESAVDPTPAEVIAYEVARDERKTVSMDREQSRVKRARTARLRLATAALRDRISGTRQRSAAIRKRLVAEGESEEMAVRWCEAWSDHAARTGVARDGSYWNHGTHWIWGERAAGRTP